MHQLAWWYLFPVAKDSVQCSCKCNKSHFHFFVRNWYEVWFEGSEYRDHQKTKKITLKTFIFFHKKFFISFGDVTSPKPKKPSIYFPKKLSYISGWNFTAPSLKNTKTHPEKNCHIFWKEKCSPQFWVTAD